MKESNGSGASRWMGFIAILVVATLIVGFGPLGSGAPNENASGAAVAHWYNTHAAQNWGSIYLVGLGLAFMLVFVTQLRSVLRQTGDGDLWPNASFAAGIIFVAGIVVLGTFQVTLMLAAHNHEYAIVKVFNFFSDNNELGIIFGICTVTLTTGLAILLNRGATPLPKTLGWYSILVGVLAIAGPLAFLDFLFLFPVWLIATGFVIGTKARRGTLGQSQEAVSGPGSATAGPADARLVTT
jgi:hypothetical protein